VAHLKSLRRRALQQVIERSDNDDPLASRVDLDASHPQRPSMVALDVPHVHDALVGRQEADHLLLAVGGGVEGDDIGVAHGLGERGGEGGEDASEPGADGGDKGDLEGRGGRGERREVVGRFAFVDVVGEGVGFGGQAERGGVLFVRAIRGSRDKRETETREADRRAVSKKGPPSKVGKEGRRRGKIRTTLATVVLLPSSPTGPVLVPAPLYPETAKTVGGLLTSR
jgi:hypothetical protein